MEAYNKRISVRYIVIGILLLAFSFALFAAKSPKAHSQTVLLLTPSANVYDTAGDTYNDVPCDQVLNGVMYCGDNTIAPIPAGENGSHDGVPLSGNKAFVLSDGQGHTFVTGENEAKQIASAKVEQNPDGTFTDAYYERLNKQFCAAKPWSCTDGVL